MRDGAGVDAVHRQRDLARVPPLLVEGRDPADLAEDVLGRAGAEGVCGEELLGAVLEPEPGVGHGEVGDPAHGAVGAVAGARRHACRRLRLPPHAPAVAPAAVDDDRIGFGAHARGRLKLADLMSLAVGAAEEQDRSELLLIQLRGWCLYTGD